METFLFYLKLGMNHITDLNGYDHMLFILTLSALYHWRSFKSIVILLTAFTLGHSLTLILSALNIFRLPADFIETLIPITIMITALYNLYVLFFNKKKGGTNYFIAIIFGLIHGMGFSNYFRGLYGADENIIVELLGFNLGVEVGQIIFVAIILLLYFIIEKATGISAKNWGIFWSFVGLVWPLLMILGWV